MSSKVLQTNSGLSVAWIIGRSDVNTNIQISRFEFTYIGSGLINFFLQVFVHSIEYVFDDMYKSVVLSKIIDPVTHMYLYTKCVENVRFFSNVNLLCSLVPDCT